MNTPKVKRHRKSDTKNTTGNREQQQIRTTALELSWIHVQIQIFSRLSRGSKPSACYTRGQSVYHRTTSAST